MFYPSKKIISAEKRARAQAVKAKMGAPLVKLKERPKMVRTQSTKDQKLTVADCVIASRFDDLDSQRRHFAREMLHMSREGHDEEDGWHFFGKTTAEDLMPSEQLDVFSRDVELSKAKQLRSAADTEIPVDAVFGYFCRLIGEDVSHFRDGHLAQNTHYFYVEHGKDYAIALYHRVIPLPWPLTARDIFAVEHSFRCEGTKGFVTYNHDHVHPVSLFGQSER